MAGSQNNLWGQHDLSRLCFGLDMDHSLRGLQPQPSAKDSTPLAQTPFFSDAYLSSESLLLRPHEGDQVVPSAQQPSAFGGPHRGSKPLPLPPPPGSEELISDEAADNEVEFFTSDRRCLLPKTFPKVFCKPRSMGQENCAFQDGSLAFSWPGREERAAARNDNFGANNCDCRETFWSKPDQNLSPQMRFPCSVPPITWDKPDIPPRIPIKPKTLKPNDKDKPPKIPPRVPLVPPCPPRTPSPKRLPIYINGVMPATQSFAANPKYVSKSLQRHHSERLPPAAPSSPCIVPILKDGRQASTTHYILLPPGRPASANRRDRLQSEPTRNGGFWQNK